MRGEDHWDDLGVKLTCEVLPIAQSTFYAHAGILKNPDLASDRAKRDADLSPENKRVWEENNDVYGIRKVWLQMQRDQRWSRNFGPLVRMGCMKNVPIQNEETTEPFSRL
jgi:hypothetical protein